MTLSSSVDSASEVTPASWSNWRRWFTSSCRQQTRQIWLTDLLVALGVMGIVGFPFSLRADYSYFFDWGVVASWVPLTLGLAVRRYSAWYAFMLMLLAFVIKLFLGTAPHGVDLGALLIIYSSAAQGSRLLLKGSGVASLILPGVLAAHLALFPGEFPFFSEYMGRGFSGFGVFVVQWSWLALILALITVLFWLAGLVQRMQRRTREAAHAAELAELEYERTQEQLVVEQERTQIARDMHDVVAHSLAVVVAQADGGRYLAKADPTQSEPVLQTISTTAREALVDVRALLAQLRHSQGDATQKSLDDIDQVFHRIRAAGLDLRVTSNGERQSLGTAAEVAVFRLIQESLTNALKYADLRSPTIVEFLWSDALHLRIRNRISPKPAIAAGSGHGLIGMRERILVVGGQVEAGPVGGDFEVRVRVPYAADNCATAQPGMLHPASLDTPIVEAEATAVDRPLARPTDETRSS